ncbi:MAG TPA: response regulator transcription factor [Kofleriaceae bacterium]|nr:response regulator transcription factor [Kofleriaceae bacterium]
MLHVREPRETAAMAVGAAIVAVDGAASVVGLIEELRRDVLEVSVASLELFEEEADLEHPVVVLRLSSEGVTDHLALFARAVGWAERRDPRPGLLLLVERSDRDVVELALSAGFDDAVRGPPSARELAARIRAVHRRVHWPGKARAGRLRHAGLTLDTDGHELWVDGQAVTLTSTELSVIRTLMRAHGRALTRGELLDAAWGAGNFEISERAVDNVILRLRRKLPRPDVIQTVRGVGFRMGGE